MLANSIWGAGPQTLRTTSLALCYSTAEYCAAVWFRSAHAHRIDMKLNKTYHTITGALKSTPLSALYRLSGISPPEVRRETIARVERSKMLRDPRHPLHDHHKVPRRLQSCRSFATVNELTEVSPPSYRLQKWQEKDPPSPNGALPEPSESLPSGSDLPRGEWVTLNRARAKVGKTGDNMLKWGFAASAECHCGADTQTMEHIMSACPWEPACTDNDLRVVNDTARHWLERWSGKI